MKEAKYEWTYCTLAVHPILHLIMSTLFICPSIHRLSILPSIYLSIRSFIYTFFHSLIDPSIHPSIHPSIYPSIHLSVHLYIHLFIILSLHSAKMWAVLARESERDNRNIFTHQCNTSWNSTICWFWEENISCIESQFT